MFCYVKSGLKSPYLVLFWPLESILKTRFFVKFTWKKAIFKVNHLVIFYSTMLPLSATKYNYVSKENMADLPPLVTLAWKDKANSFTRSHVISRNAVVASHGYTMLKKVLARKIFSNMLPLSPSKSINVSKENMADLPPLVALAGRDKANIRKLSHQDFRKKVRKRAILAVLALFFIFPKFSNLVQINRIGA